MTLPQAGLLTTRRLWAGILVCALCSVPHAAHAQTQPTSAPATPRLNLITPELIGRTVEEVRILGNTMVSSAVIRNVIRTREGEKYDPATVEEDYQRVYGLRKFSNVEAKVEPTGTGVIVAFIVSEQKEIRGIRYLGNVGIDTNQLSGAVDIHPGEAIDRFRISLAKQAIERLYREKNYPYAHVEVSDDELARKGDVVFNIVEGPNVRVRKVDFQGIHSFTVSKLKDQIKTAYWIWIFRPGTLDMDELEDDVASLRRFYESKGFFDVRVGRKVIVSPNQTEVQVTFVVEEGVRYIVDRVTFQGNVSLSEAQLRRNLKLVEGRPYDRDGSDRDIREMVRSYSPFGYIYEPQSNDADYLRIEAKTIFRGEPGHMELVYQINEGKPFHLGRVLVKGNAKTQQKVIYREMHVVPGQLYNSGEIQDATDRLKGTPYFSAVTMTPIGSDPETRDLLVDVTEGHTASFNVGAGINSNGGVGGNITYEQRNFDIANWPESWHDLFSDRTFTGAGQTLVASFEPGTEQTNATLRFVEPWLFDQPYSFGNEIYLVNRIREHYDDRRIGDRITFGKRFTDVYSASLSLRGEDVNIKNIEDRKARAQEILDLAGHTTLTSVGLQLRRDTTNHGFAPYKGTSTTLGWESFGLLGGQFTFQKISLNYDYYKTLNEDLLDRKTILSLHGDSGYIVGNDPFFERFYGGGLGSIRGFRFRGVSPREGPDHDVIGGDWIVTGSAEVSFPLAGDSLRGVVFTDVGDVESDVRLGTIRSSIGTGIRLTLPFFAQAPVAIDFAFPLSKSGKDDVQYISFSFGFSPG